jgi:hypothetical protein
VKDVGIHHRDTERTEGDGGCKLEIQ